MQIARDAAKRRLLRRDQLLRQFSTLLGQAGEPREHNTVRANKAEACQHNDRHGERQESISIVFDLGVERGDLLARARLLLVILYKQSRRQSGQRLLPWLQRVEYHLPRPSILAAARQVEHRVARAPEI